MPKRLIKPRFIGCELTVTAQLMSKPLSIATMTVLRCIKDSYPLQNMDINSFSRAELNATQASIARSESKAGRDRSFWWSTANGVNNIFVSGDGGGGLVAAHAVPTPTKIPFSDARNERTDPIK